VLEIADPFQRGGDLRLQRQIVLVGLGQLAAEPKPVLKSGERGPLVVAADNERGYAEVGIVSWGPQCGNPLYPGVYTRVSSFSKWINDNMSAN
jgi:secreted trypsin-like serine protease